MIGIGRFVLNTGALAVPIWWVYAASLLLIAAGFFFGRMPMMPPTGMSEHSVTPPA
jgi:uncharacterized membrane protein YhhN